MQPLTTDDHKTIDSAVKRLENGDCIALPTETVYGLAADATNGKAVAKIFELKQRPSFNPLICHVSGLEMAESFSEISDIARKLAEKFWPGPLTLVVPVKPDSPIHPLVTAELGTVGVRCPKGIASTIIETFGKPLAAPSANKSGKISPTQAHHVRDEFDEVFIIDGGSCDVGLESTIVKLEGEQLTLLRPGAITIAEIEDVAGIPVTQYDGGDIQAPGMMKSHYAPSAGVLLDCETCEQDYAWLQFGSCPSHRNALNLSPDGDLQEAAANLYDYLKELDAKGAETICVSPIPNVGLGIAINDRLQRAAAPRD